MIFKLIADGISACNGCIGIAFEAPKRLVFAQSSGKEHQILFIQHVSIPNIIKSMKNIKFIKASARSKRTFLIEGGKLP